MKTLILKIEFDPDTSKIEYCEIKDEDEIIDGFEADDYDHPRSFYDVIEMLRYNFSEMVN